MFLLFFVCCSSVLIARQKDSGLKEKEGSNGRIRRTVLHDRDSLQASYNTADSETSGRRDDEAKSSS